MLKLLRFRARELLLRVYNNLLVDFAWQLVQLVVQLQFLLLSLILLFLQRVDTLKLLILEVCDLRFVNKILASLDEVNGAPMALCNQVHIHITGCLTTLFLLLFKELGSY